MRSQGALCVRIRRDLLDEEAVALVMIQGHVYVMVSASITAEAERQIQVGSKA